MNLKFFLSATFALLAASLAGFFSGLTFSKDLFYSTIKDPYAEEALGFIPYGIFFSLLGFLIGLIISLVIIERLGRKWGHKLNFGSHPVLKLTLLSFLTFLGLLVLLLFLIPTK